MLSSNEILSQGMQPNSKLDLKCNDPAQLETDVPNHFLKVVYQSWRSLTILVNKLDLTLVSIGCETKLGLSHETSKINMSSNEVT